MIDGSDTHLLAGGNGVVFHVLGTASATLEGVSLSSNGSASAIETEPASSLLVFGASVDGATSNGVGTVLVHGGQLSLVEDTFTNLTQDVVCGNNGNLLVDRCTFESSRINSDGCGVIVTRSRFDHFLGEAQNGEARFENNLITSDSQFDDAATVLKGTAGSYFRFNTFANTSGVVFSAGTLQCDDSIEVSSNIFAWGTTVPPTCFTTYSLFDANVMQQGSGNQSADGSTFFVSPDSGDFHLGSNSPAKGAADPSQTSTTIDFDGNPRPNPAGSVPDIGAFEAP
nr:choice-of-anchor Q domain-containing protein [Kofleriaceae bacterium]